MNFARLPVRSLLPALAAGVLALTGCAGYQFGPVKPEKLAAIETIAVPTFKNMTLEPRSSVLVTNEVIARLQQDGTFRIGTTAGADAVLKGTIAEVRRRQLRATRTNVLKTREMEVQIFIDYSLEDAKTNVVLAEGRARGSSNLFLDQNFQLSERQALNEAAENAARDIVTRLTEGIPGQSGVSGGHRDTLDSERDRAF